MMFLKAITTGSVLIGIVILLFSLKPTMNLTKETQQKNGWKVLTVMIFGFIAGYTFFLWRTQIAPVGYTELSVGMILFGGSGFVIIVVRMSEKSVLFAERIAALERFNSLHDSLTGLPNRKRLLDKLGQAIEVSKSSQSSIYVFLIDLDRFKEVNDTLGHHVGDKVLKHITPHLASAVRKNDIIARLGGDEFAVVLPDIDHQTAERIAQKIIKIMDQYFYIEQHRLKIGLSIGISSYPDNGLDTDILLQKADVAMYVAKRQKSGFSFYDPDQDIYSIQRLKLSQDLEKAIKDNQIDLYYQPIIDLKTHTVKGFEALSRWKNSDGEFIPPSDFIQLAKQTGWIRDITRNSLERGIKQLAQWNARGLQCYLTINISLYDFKGQELVSSIENLLSSHNVNPNTLVLEITEGSIMTDDLQVQSTLKQLNKLGIMIAIDDFGTGYSSLSRLKQLPINIIKIDKSFIFELMNDENDAIIVRSTIDLAHNMKKIVVAEGVENIETIEILRNLGCDYVQGFYYSRAMPADKVELWLNNFHDSKVKKLEPKSERRRLKL